VVFVIVLQLITSQFTAGCQFLTVPDVGTHGGHAVTQICERVPD